jgi:hypothetical protein
MASHGIGFGFGNMPVGKIIDEAEAKLVIVSFIGANVLVLF